MAMFRTRFAREIVTEFLPPARNTKTQRAIILCDGMPSVPRKQPLCSWLADKGFWVFYPRYRGAWESDGSLLEESPHEDVLDVISGLGRGFRELTFGQKFSVTPDEVFVIGGSFGGATALMCSLDPRVKRVIANCPVVDWSTLRESEKAETSNPNYAAYIREAFGNGYRLSGKNWKKLYTGKFFNPMHHADEIDPKKVMMFHAKDDPNIPWQSVEKFAKKTGVKLKLLARGGHLKTEFVLQKYWPQIEKFFSRP
jgi:dipeptidyl aminopeptidase/acylaminoacyl peptidase